MKWSALALRRCLLLVDAQGIKHTISIISRYRKYLEIFDINKWDMDGAMIEEVQDSH